MKDFLLANYFIDDFYEDRINNSKICESDFAKRKIERWKSQGCYTVALMGGFDILTLNHARGLIQARILAALHILNIKTENFNSENMTKVLDYASSNNLKLIVSVDTNETIEECKNMKPEKGLSERPILDWENRTKIMSLIAMPTKFANSRFVIDCITAHGKSACKVHDTSNCLVQKSTYLICELGADINIIKNDCNTPAIRHKFSESNIIFFNENDGAYIDRILKSQISTTNIVKKIRK